MKGFFIACVWALLFYSCKEVSFPEPQPAGVNPLKEVPPSLRGAYLAMDDHGNDTDTLIIESWGYHFKDVKGVDWLGRGFINDSLVLKFYENYFFVNIRTGDQWILRLIKQKPSGDMVFMSVNIADDAKRKTLLKKMNKILPVKEIQSKDDTFYRIAPTKEQLLQMIREGFFTGHELSRIN
jgi:hypothetical protein